MKVPIFLVLLALSATALCPQELFNKKYSNQRLYVATYDSRGFNGFRTDKKIKFSKGTSKYYKSLNNIVDSLDFLDWNNDTVYSMNLESKNWNMDKKSRILYSILWRQIRSENS